MTRDRRDSTDDARDATSSIPALVPRGAGGFQFSCYADCCSGVPGDPHEGTFASVNAVVRRLAPPPDFICFPGDHIRGLTTSAEELRRQWAYWQDVEMGWTSRRSLPVYPTTGNHTTYDVMSEDVFREVHSHLPQNGPADQRGLTYFIRRNDALFVFINTNWSGLGGEGRVETTWLDRTLSEHADAKYKLVFGHHPAFPVNGFSGQGQRELHAECRETLWPVLVRHGVLAYFCSHILAFDVQVHDGVLQVVTAGAGTAHLMPDETEYFHCVQAAVDEVGIRYQVLDISGRIREALSWPLRLAPSDRWDIAVEGREAMPEQETEAMAEGRSRALIVAWRIRGRARAAVDGHSQTLLSGWNDDTGMPSVWVGLRGPEQRLVVLLSPKPGQSPHLWFVPDRRFHGTFDHQIAIHTGMGPGGILGRVNDDEPWSSLVSASPWGAERCGWPMAWSVGHDRSGPTDRPFLGSGLEIRRLVTSTTL